MAKFCTKCGRPLAEGEICTCEQTNQNIQEAQPQPEQGMQQSQPQPEQGAQQSQPQSEQGMQQSQPQPEQVCINQPSQQMKGQNISAYLKKLVSLFKNIIQFPATQGTNFVISEDRNSALGLIGVQAVFSAVFALVVASKVGSLFNVVGGIFSKAVKMPYFRIFIVTLIISFALSCVLAGILLGISILFKNKITYQAALCVTAVRSVALASVTIIAILLAFLNLGYGIVLFFMGNLAGICYMLSAFPITSQENRNKAAIIMFLSVLIFALIASFIMSKCAALYLPNSVKDSISSVSKMLTNPSEFFDSIIGNIY